MFNLYSYKQQHYLEASLHTILNKARNGESKAIAWLYQQYCKNMFNICVRMVGDRSSAEDVLQDGFILAFNNLHQLKNDQQFGGWLKRIIINECIKHSKKKVGWDEWNDANFEQITEDATHWWLEIDSSMIYAQIKNLPDGCRQVFNLFVLEDYSHKAIAESLNISENTSKSQYHRARQLLKQRIAQQIHKNG